MPKFLSSSSISRRGTLAGLAGATALSALPARLLAEALPVDSSFRHGVASGDPDETSVVLWTRITAAEASGAGESEVEWEVSRSRTFDRIVAAGRSIALAERDFTVKVLATGLAPGATFHYRFRTRGAVSPVGRTRTLPTGRLDRLGIALASCSNYAFGFFNAYEAIARDPGIDFVLHTGDYIYEYGSDGWGAETARKLGRVHVPANEIVSLSDYRQRHAQYKSDRGSQAMHAAHPLLACWDDHESANNPWTGGAQNHQPATEGDWHARRTAAIRAYYEWMPIREPAAGQRREDFWRAYRFGDLATMVTLESRHTGRALQVDYAEHRDRVGDKAAAAAFERDVLGDPARTMLSAPMLDFFGEQMGRSVRQGQPWRLVGNAIPMARTRVPDLVKLGFLPDPAANPAMSGDARELAWKGRWNLPFFPDTWDGYPIAREGFYARARAAGASDLIVLTGDSHSFWANQLFDGNDKPMGLELGTAGITSPGDFIASGFSPEAARKLDKVFADHNREVRWTDNMHQGYVRLVLGRARARADYVAVSTVLSPVYATRVIRSEPIVRKAGRISFAGQ